MMMEIWNRHSLFLEVGLSNVWKVASLPLMPLAFALCGSPIHVNIRVRMIASV